LNRIARDRCLNAACLPFKSQTALFMEALSKKDRDMMWRSIASTKLLVDVLLRLSQCHWRYCHNVTNEFAVFKKVMHKFFRITFRKITNSFATFKSDAHYSVFPMNVDLRKRSGIL